MANRPKGFGMTAELANKKAAKFDCDLAQDVMNWLKSVLEDGGKGDLADKLPSTITSQNDVGHPLKDGSILCQVLNIIKPGSIKKINDSKLALKMMENTSKFLDGCEALGCKKTDLFQTVDLYEMQNIPQVVNGIIALGRKAQNHYDGPTLGPAESTENKRTFTEEQLSAGKNIIGLQAGSNQGASQKGMNFGKSRAIID